MTKPKVLIGTCVYADPTLPFMLGIMEAMQLQDADYVFSVQKATYVQTGRCNLVYEARKHGCDEIVYVDADIGISAAVLRRLRSHDVDIVGAVYAKRVPGEPQWTVHRAEGEQKGDLVPVNDIGAGMLRVKMRVFDAIDQKFPHRRYQHGSEDPRMEYFPIGLTVKNGWEHPAEARLRRFLALVEYFEEQGATSVPLTYLTALKEPETSPFPEITGEDVAFIRLAKACGFQAYADTGLIVPHFGQISFPAKSLL